MVERGPSVYLINIIIMQCKTDRNKHEKNIEYPIIIMSMINMFQAY